MTTVTDPNGVRWSVERAWFSLFLSGAADAPGDAGFEGLVLVVVTWPFWFIAHWLGLRWVIGIFREGTEVGRERVRGWRKSGQRVQEIAELAAAGMWQRKHQA